MGNSFRRIRYLVDTSFQLKFAAMILAFMFMTAFFTALVIYYQTWMLLGDKLANIYPQGRLMIILRDANLGLFTRVLLLSPLVALFAIVLSHRIAGPIYRIKQDLDRVARGEFAVRLHLRKTDELKDVAESINKVLEILDKKNK